MITKTIPISTRIVIVIRYAMKWSVQFEFIGKSMKTETKAFPNGGEAIVEQILASEEINKSKRAGLCESRSEIVLGKLNI